MASEILTLDHVDAFYGDSHVLHDVGFALTSGMVLGLLGRNGAGKSTCLSTIIGFLRPKRGVIRLDGRDICGLSPEAISHKGISLVPQGRRVFKTLSVRENLIVAAQRAGRNGAGVAWSLDKVFDAFPRLKERQGQTSALLSGGEQQMLAIGRALVSNPRVLLLDEPSEGLAPQIVAEVGRTVAQLKSEGLSIILVEQNIKFTMQLADKIVILNTGSVVFDDTPARANADQSFISQHLGVF